MRVISSINSNLFRGLTKCSTYSLLLIYFTFYLNYVGAQNHRRIVPSVNNTKINQLKGIHALGTGTSNWDPQFANGTDDAVLTIAAKGDTIYAGGSFIYAGGKLVNHIAKWDGTNWTSLGDGLNGIINSILVDGNNIYAAGYVSSPNNQQDIYVAKWDGKSWSQLGGYFNGNINSMVKIGNNLYVGGWFTDIDGKGANNVARWDGSNWYQLGSGTDNIVYSLATDGTNLFAGGEFVNAGNVSANYIAQWDGFAWSNVGGGVDAPVYAINSLNTDIYVGGAFTKAGNVNCSGISKWDGSQWINLGSGVNTGGYVNSIYAVNNQKIFITGEFTTVGNVNATNISKWNGTSWSPLSTGIDAIGYCVVNSGNNLYVGGYFINSGNMQTEHIAKWDGTNFNSLGNSVNSTVYAITKADSNIYVGGEFVNAGNVQANRIVKWDSHKWISLGKGFNDRVNVIVVKGNDVYAAGKFTLADGDSAKYIARWDGKKWNSVGGGFSDEVMTLCFNGNDLYAGGNFDEAGGVPAGFIAKWDGTQWNPVQFGFETTVNSIVSYENNIYAGGWFSRAWDKRVNFLGKWDGTNWIEVDSTLNGPVNSMAVVGDKLYIGGMFKTAGGDTSLAGLVMWNGKKMSALDKNVKISNINSLSSYNNNLYAAGSFSPKDASLQLNNIAKWDGTKWSDMEGGTDGIVFSVLATETDVFAGGTFKKTGAVAADCFGRYGTAPYKTGKPALISKCEGDTLILTPNVKGSQPFTCQWYKNNTIINGATSGIYKINKAALNDSGYYYCSISNYLGNIKSDSIRVRMSKLPIANAGADQTINSGQNVTLSSTINDNYLWSTKETTRNITVSPTETTIYYLTVTSNAGCSASNLVVITVGTSTCNANAGKDTTICSGHSAVLTATGGATYSWNTGASTYKITVTPTSTSTYVVTIKIGNCSASDNVVVNVITSPLANAGADQTITVGSSATLNATGNGIYSWSNNMTGTGITVSPTITTSYTLSVISGICTSTDLVVVVVKQPCNIKVDAGNDITIDKGQKVTLHTKVIGCNGCQYNWGNGLGNTDSLVVSPTATTTYVIKVTSNDGCTAVAAVVVNIKGVGINEYNADAGSINIFPVPAENFVFIDCDRPINLIRVYNAYGDLLYEDNKSDNNRLKKIDVRKYSKGIYFIRIYTNKGNIVRKIIK